MSTSTLAFIRQEWRFLLFGALLTFWTSPGQTYLISLFGDQLRHDFGLSHGDFGILYTLATVVSATILWTAGRLVDRLSFARFVWWICVAMVVGTMAFSQITGPLGLFLGILLVRFLGQGMMSHIAVTAMARRYVTERGRAIAIAGFGFPIGEALFPPLITLGLSLTSWQNIWLCIGLAAALTLLPAVSFLLKRAAAQDQQAQHAAMQAMAQQRQWTRAEMLRDPRFFMLAPLVMTMSAIFTGIIFHQKYIIATLKAWDFLWWSVCFAVFAAAQVIGSFASGWLVDRLSARRLAPFVLMPFALSLGLLGFAKHDYWAPLIMATMGLSAGATNPTYSSLWAELYGTRYLGAIRAAGVVLMVFASALGPVLVGWALDREVSILTISITSVAVTVFTSGLSVIGLRREA